MAQQTAYVNIAQLPQVQQINNGDLLVVSTPNGTYTIDFENFIIPGGNSTFYPVVCANSQNIASLSAYIDTSIQSLSSAVDAEYSQLYIGKAAFNIANGNSQSQILVPALPSGVSISSGDINVSATNAIAALSAAYVSGVNIINGNALVTLTSPFNYGMAPATFNVNVVVTY